MNKTLLIPLWGLFCEIQVSIPLKFSEEEKNYTIHYSRHIICIEHFLYCGSCQNIPCSATSALWHYVLLVTPWNAFPMESTTLQHAKHPIPCIFFPFAGWLRFICLPFPGRHIFLLKIYKSVGTLQVCIRRDTLNDLKVDSLYGVFLWDHFSLALSPVVHRYLFWGEPVCFVKLQGLHIDFSVIMKHRG